MSRDYRKITLDRIKQINVALPCLIRVEILPVPEGVVHFPEAQRIMLIRGPQEEQLAVFTSWIDAYAYISGFEAAQSLYREGGWK